MVEEFDDRAGKWWVPDHPEHKVTGTLIIGELGELHLQFLVDHKDTTSKGLPSIVNPTCDRNDRILVHGIDANGRRLTLFEGFVVQRRFGSSGIHVGKIYFNRGIEGALIDKPEDLTVKRIFSRPLGFDVWMSQRPFEFISEFETRRFGVTFQQPSEEKFNIDSNRNCIFSWTSNGPAQSIVQTEVKMQAMPWISIEYALGVALDESLNDMGGLVQLLTILLGAPSRADELLFFAEGIERVHDDESSSPVELRLMGKAFDNQPTFHKWTPSDVLFAFPSIEARFKEVLQKWYKLRAQCWAAIVPYVLCLQSPAVFAERRLFELAAVAESLHRHLFPDAVNFPAHTAATVCRTLKPSIPKHLRRYFFSSLRRVHELTFTERITRLMAKYPQIVEYSVGNQDAQKRFCKLVRDLRNHEAHRLQREDATNLPGINLVRIASKLRVLIDAWILGELGFTDEEIFNHMTRNEKYGFFASNVSWRWDE